MLRCDQLFANSFGLQCGRHGHALLQRWTRFRMKRGGQRRWSRLCLKACRRSVYPFPLFAITSRRPHRKGSLGEAVHRARMRTGLSRFEQNGYVTCICNDSYATVRRAGYCLPLVSRPSSTPASWRTATQHRGRRPLCLYCFGLVPFHLSVATKRLHITEGDTSLLEQVSSTSAS